MTRLAAACADVKYLIEVGYPWTEAVEAAADWWRVSKDKLEQKLSPHEQERT